MHIRKALMRLLVVMLVTLTTNENDFHRGISRLHYSRIRLIGASKDALVNEICCLSAGELPSST